MKIKSLIIKSSFSALDSGGLKSNLGDLLRTTVLIECVAFPYLWLTDKMGKTILKHFMDPKIIITYDEIQKLLPKFDNNILIYNLDNHDCNLEQLYNFKGTLYGYNLDLYRKSIPQNQNIASLQPYRKTTGNKSYQCALVEGAGFKWQKQDYAQNRIKQQLKYDVGLNNHVHHGWQSKCWPKQKWLDLEKCLKKNYSVSWQQGLNNIDEYIQWIDSCHVVITHDTFGLHLASALRKKIVAIVGSTDNNEFSYNRVTTIKPAPRECMPCHKAICAIPKACIHEITVKNVMNETLKNLLDKAALQNRKLNGNC